MLIEKIIHRGESRIRVSIPYEPKSTALIKEIPGARWSKTLKSWHLPDTMEAIRMVKDRFGDTEPLQNAPISAERELLKESSACSGPSSHHSVEIYVLFRKIVIKMPKNEEDIRFIRSVRFFRWNKSERVWEVPNYPGNLEKIKGYFGDRISVLSNPKPISEVRTGRLIGTDEVVCIRTPEDRVKILCAYNHSMGLLVKKIPYSRWDSVNKWWTIPYAAKFLKEIEQEAQQQHLKFIYEEEQPALKLGKTGILDNPHYRPCPEEFVKKLIELRYSPNTIKSYKGCLEEFINYYPRHDINRIDESMIISFIRYLVTERKVSISYQNVSINAIKFYYEHVLGGQRKIYQIERPRQEQKLPVVLSEDEVALLFKHIENIKHKAILMLIYSSGLRVGELIRLKITDIDSKRFQVRITQSKGKKDRYSLLSKKMVEILRRYYMEYKPMQWLFEGIKGEQYSESSIQHILKQAAARGGIKKRISVHTLRHSFATHLLEKGVDIRYIQSLLGHESTKTTEIYTHITTRGFDQIKNPLDGMDI